MVRYKKQTDTFRCGPIAILNALKWAGIKPDLKKLERQTKCKSPSSGTSCQNLQSAIFSYKEIRVRVSHKVRIDDVRSHLFSGKSIVYFFRYHNKKDNGRYGHFFFIDGISKTGKSLYVVNYQLKSPARIRITTKRFINECIRGDANPSMWVVSK